MTDQNHPITPSKTLEHKWATMFEQHSDMEVFTEVARWGADQELEACCEWADATGWEGAGDSLRAARRPKPPSLNEQALAALQEAAYMADDSPPQGICSDQIDTIRRALEALDD